MAEGTQLVFEFADADAHSVFFVFPYGDDDASSADITAAANAIISNGSIFQNPPVRLKSVKAIISTECEYDLDA